MLHLELNTYLIIYNYRSVGKLALTCKFQNVNETFSIININHVCLKDIKECILIN